MKKAFSTIRRLGAAVLGKPSSRPQRSRNPVSKKTVTAPPGEAATIEAFLLNAHQLLATAGASSALSSHGVTLPDWLLLRELRDSPSSLRLAARRLRLPRAGVRQHLQRLVKLGLVRAKAVKVGEIEEQRFEPSTKGAELLKAFAAELDSTGVAGGTGHRRATRFVSVLQRALQKSAAAA